MRIRRALGLVAALVPLSAARADACATEKGELPTWLLTIGSGLITSPSVGD